MSCANNGMSPFVPHRTQRVLSFKARASLTLRLSAPLKNACWMSPSRPFEPEVTDLSQPFQVIRVQFPMQRPPAHAQSLRRFGAAAVGFVERADDELFFGFL